MTQHLDTTRAEHSDPTLDETRRAERRLARGIIIGIVVAVPVCIALWIGLIALAVRGETSDLGGPLILGCVIGLLSGVFFGTWAGFVSAAHTLEELDREALRRARPPGAT